MSSRDGSPAGAQAQLCDEPRYPLRRQRAEPVIVPSRRVVGVDEFALRRGVT